MTRDRESGRQTLQRIADALGTDVSAFTDAGGGAPAVREALELLTAFESITERKDRRACVDFVRAMASPQRVS